MGENVLPSPELLRQLLSYSRETGKLYWKKRPPDMFSSVRICNSWNTKHAGKEAFTAIKSDGYPHGKIFDRVYTAHRVIWAMVYGSWPDNEIDHIDLVKSNNRITNLRPANRNENVCNVANRADNTSGYKGVSFHKLSAKWRARISIDSRRKHLGTFASPEAAHAAYVAAAKKYHGEFANYG